MRSIAATMVAITVAVALVAVWLVARTVAFSPSFINCSRDDCCNLYQVTERMDRFFRKHDIPYVLAYGSHIGARRCTPPGPMSWDDDVDTIILERDEPRFRAALERDREELGRDLRWQDTRAEPYDFGWQFAMNDDRLASGRASKKAFVYDVFVFRYRADERLWRGEQEHHCTFRTEDELFPARHVPFWNLELPIPRRGDALLKRWYGPRVLTHAKLYNHRIKPFVSNILAGPEIDLRKRQNRRWRRSIPLDPSLVSFT